MTNFIYAIGDFFEFIFQFMPLIGDYMNYFYIIVISVFLIVWTIKMIGFRKRGEEHASL